MVEEPTHPVTGAYKTFRSIFTMSATPGSVYAPSPALGQQGAELLKTLCGYDAERISSLKAEGVIAVTEI